MTEKLNPADWSDPISGFRATRRYLPHMQAPGSHYFTTSTTHKRMPLTLEERAKILAAIRFHDGRKYELEIAVVMPDHFHMLLHPLEKSAGVYFSLEEIFHSIKSYTAHQLGKTHLWQDENYDHVIRDERDFWARYQYVLHNPVKAELAERPEDYPFLYYRGM